MSSVSDATTTPKKGLGKSPIPDHRVHKARFKKKKQGKQQQESISDDSEDESLESEQTPDSMESKSNSSKQNKGRRKKRDTFEILEGLKAGQKFDEKPKKCEGFLMKRRKWPMKGWHKRYFLLENGFLIYAKSLNDIQKGKIHGSMDIGLSVISFKRESGRIDIDAEETIYHLKMIRANKNSKVIDEWLDRFRHHRLYRQHEITYGSTDAPKLTDVSTPVEELTPRTSPVSPSINPERRGGSFKRNREMSQNKVAAWLLDTAGIEQCNKDLSKAQAAIYELSEILEKLYKCSLANHTQAPDSMFEQSLSNSFSSSTPAKSQSQDSEPPNLTASLNAPGGLLTPPPIHVSSSNPNLLTNHEKERARPTSMPDYWMTGGLDPKLQETKLREDFLNTAKTTHETLRSLSRTISTERERLKCALEQQESSGASPVMGGSSYVQSLKNSLADALKQNTDLRNRIMRIHADSNLSSVQQPSQFEVQLSASGADSSSFQKSFYNGTLTPCTPVLKEHPLLTNTTSWESASVSEFYDAAEHLSSETSDVSDEEEMSSDISDTENTAAPSCVYDNMEVTAIIGDGNCECFSFYDVDFHA